MDIKQIIYNQENYFNTSYVKVYNMLHYIVVELLSNCLKMFVFQIIHYFSAPTAKKDQTSTTIDTIQLAHTSRPRPTSNQQTENIHIHIRKGISGPHYRQVVFIETLIELLRAH
jgi:hypothetical protein